jgi:hypothetical protein
MFKYLIPATFALFAATPALAQNDAEAQVGRASEWTDAPVQTSRSVLFTAVGTYADQTGARLIDVRTDGDADGDGVMDKGVLRVTCNGGDMVTGVFSAGGAVDKARQADGAAAYAAGKTFKGRWGVVAAADGKPVTIGAGQPDVCAGLG